MLNYRLYFLRGGHITHYVQIESASDEAAITAAEKHGKDVLMELWQGARLVKRFQGDLENSADAQPTK